MRGLGKYYRPVTIALCVLLLSTLASYGLASRGQASKRSATSADTTKASQVFPSGNYLVAYVLVASECGFCSEALSKKAIGSIRDSLIANNKQKYAAISVVGVAIDDDLDTGIKYLRSFSKGLSQTFDQIVVGGSWLNETFAAMAWRDHIATTQIPQVLVFSRRIDATGYPHEIGIRPDSLVFNFSGRDSLLAWVNSGARVGR